jgi:Ca-activated chloride channel family protein
VTLVRLNLSTVAALLVMSLTGTAAAQAPPVVVDAPPTTQAVPPVFPMDVDVTNVTVTVLDAAGRLVTDLSRTDFMVLEDGQLQDVVVFGNALEGTTIDDASAGTPPRDVMTLDLGLLLDTSGSMLKELKLSKEAAVRFLDTVPRARELYTVFFDEEIRLSRYDSEVQQGLFERIAELKGGGDTALHDAIATYISRVQGAPGRKTLVIFSDGEDTRSSLGLNGLFEVIRSSSVTIYPIRFTGGFSPGSSRALKARAFLQQIAEMTGGQVLTPHSSRELGAIYQRILSELGAQYVLGFLSTNPRHDGKFRKLNVAVKRPGLKIRHRRGYYAPVRPAASR